MRAAAHDVGAAHHHQVAGRARGLGRRPPPSGTRRCARRGRGMPSRTAMRVVVVAGHRQAGGARRGGDAVQRRRHLVGARGDACRRAPGTRPASCRRGRCISRPSTGIVQLLQDRRRVVVERQQMHAARPRCRPARCPARRGCRPPTADARACRRSSVRASSASSSACHAVEAAQPRLPRQRHAVERRGDAVGEQLRLGVAQRDVGREIDAGPRLHLPLERVAVDVDDARQHQQAGRIERGDRAAPRRCAAMRAVLSVRSTRCQPSERSSTRAAGDAQSMSCVALLMVRTRSARAASDSSR